MTSDWTHAVPATGSWAIVASTADKGWGGGVFIIHSDDATLTGNEIVSNTAGTAVEGYGGGVYVLYSNNAVAQRKPRAGQYSLLHRRWFWRRALSPLCQRPDAHRQRMVEQHVLLDGLGLWRRALRRGHQPPHAERQPPAGQHRRPGRRCHRGRGLCPICQRCHRAGQHRGEQSGQHAGPGGGGGIALDHVSGLTLTHNMIVSNTASSPRIPPKKVGAAVCTSSTARTPR